MTFDGTQSELWHALTEYLRVLPEEARLQAHAAAVRTVAEAVQRQGDEIASPPPSERAREILAGITPEQAEGSRADDTAIVRRGDMLAFAGSGVPAMSVMTRVAMRMPPDQIRERWPELRDEDLSLASALGLAYAIGSWRRVGDVDDADLASELQRDWDSVRAEDDARSALRAEINRLPAGRRTGILEHFAGQAAAARRGSQSGDGKN